MGSTLGAAKVRLWVSGLSIEFCSTAPASAGFSRLTSRSQVRLKSSEARRNSARFLPSERLIWGSLRGPKNTSAITKMKTNSVLPNESRISKTTFSKYLSTLQLGKPARLTIVTCRQTKQKVASGKLQLRNPIDLGT